MQTDQILNLFNLRPLEKEVFGVCLESGLIGATALAQKLVSAALQFMTSWKIY